MVEPSQFANFIEKAKQNIDQIKFGLLRHDKNPKDREFLNDISKSINSIKNAAMPLGLSRIMDLCHNLDNLISLIREEKKELHQEIIIIIAACRDRFAKLIFELETVRMERSKVKDLVTRIQQLIDDYNKVELPETEAPLVADSTDEQERVLADGKESSLLPVEIINKEYDEELFQIFIEQLQENISLLRALTDTFADAPRKDMILSQCSNLVGKLQFSANYMGYERLAEFYLQWVAELEMAGVNLSMGTSFSLEFMDQNIRKIVDLFPEIKDQPADPATLNKNEKTPAPPPPVMETEDDEDLAATKELQELFSGMDEGEDEEFDDGQEPIAALSGVNSFDEEESAAAADDRKQSPATKESRGKKIIEIDGSFLEEEKESENYDEELFQIFVEQLQQNISQLQQLTDSFTSEPNKAKIIDKCSNLVDKLQSSANYMGYERLAEFYLQWIAELEMTGVEHSIGSDISFDFMRDKINRITGLFPEAGGTPSASSKTGTAEKAAVPISEKPQPRKEPVIEEPAAPVYDDLIEEDEEEEEEPPLAEGVKPIAGIAIADAADDEEAETSLFAETADQEDGEFIEAVEEKLESFFADIGEPEENDELESSFMAIASLSEEDEDTSMTMTGEVSTPAALTDTLPADDENALSLEGIEQIAGISDEEAAESEKTVAALFGDEPVADTMETESTEFSDSLNEKLENFFTDMEGPEEEDIDASLMEIASISDEPEEEQGTAEEEISAPADEREDLFTEEEKESPPLEIAGISDLSADEATGHGEVEAADFSEAIDEKFESFFADIEEPEGDEELETSFMEIASTGEEETTEGPVKFTAEPPADDGLENLFEDEEEEPLAEGVEPIAGLFEEEPPFEAEETTEVEFGESVDEKLESFFTDLEEPESVEDIEASLMEIASINEEAEEETAEVAITGPLAEDMVEDIDAFFNDEEAPEPEEEGRDILSAETKEIEEPVEEQTADIATLFPEGEEEVEVTGADLADELLTDDELLEEIAGPTVGEKEAAGTELLIPETAISDKVIAALSDEKLIDEELFRKLEGAIAKEDKATGDTEGFTVDEQAFAEYETAGTEPEAPPERRELFQKLSSALQSLDDETGYPDEAEEPEEKEPETEFDYQLFNRLVSALETPAEKADITEARPIDLVMEEILSGAPAKTAPIVSADDAIPRKLAASEIKQIIRMDTDKVDQLMNQVGELDVNRSTLGRLFAEMNDLHHHYLAMEGFNKQELKPFKELLFRLGDTSVSLNRLSSEIREGVLKVRLVPIGLLFDRYHPLINKLTSGTGKQVELEIDGEDTELEKMVIDEISEPLTHIISNTVEHGIEPADERKSLGKEETGKIRLKAYHENNEIVIEVTDDGRGIDLKKVKAEALKLGLFTGDELFKMSDSDLKRLILNPAFSTVTDQGRKPEDRGQGLHVVKTSIDKLKGSIDIRSKAGRGTIIQIRIPLNLLVIKALQVRAGKETMALPVNCVEEILKVSDSIIFDEDGHKFITIHDATVPVFKLTEVFNIEPVPSHDEKVYIIIVQADQQSIGLIVDETAGIEEIVIKPLGELLRRESGFSGATIISDGNISLIPDVAELIRIAKKHRTVAEEA